LYREHEESGCRQGAGAAEQRKSWGKHEISLVFSLPQGLSSSIENAGPTLAGSGNFPLMLRYWTYPIT
jgi:hypothetical protein